MRLQPALQSLLVAGLFPAWLAAGFADWLCHRKAELEQTSGPRESRLHFLLQLEIAAPVIVALFFEINALLLALMTVAMLAHTATSLWDTYIAQPRRHISPLEQHVHSWLEMLPVFALIVAFVLHFPAGSPDWTFRPRATPLPIGGVLAVIALFALGFAFIGEEWLRGIRASRARS